MNPTGLLLSDDLLFISRITGTARSLGLELKPARAAAELLSQARSQTPACVLVDLQNPGLDIAAAVRNLKGTGNPYIVGYGSHVDTATLKAARAAGVKHYFVEQDQTPGDPIESLRQSYQNLSKIW